MVDYHNQVRCDFGVLEIEYPVSGGRIELAIRQGVSNKWAASVMTAKQARELAAMLHQAADAADGLPARPVAIEDVPLQYVARADFKAPDSDPAIHGRLIAEDTSDVE